MIKKSSEKKVVFNIGNSHENMSSLWEAASRWY